MESTMHSGFFLILVPTLLIACAAFTIGLTYAPCYSSLCVEQLHPYQTRIHIGAYYALLATTGLFLVARAYLRPVRRLLDTYIWDGVIPIVGNRLSIGGLLLALWISVATFGSIGYWLQAQYGWWYDRGALVDWTQPSLIRAAWTGITGHWCDVWIGLVMLPVGRDSIIGRVFCLHASALLFAHKLLAYALFVGALVHGITYYAFVASLVSAPATAQAEFLVDNPTVSVAESAAQGPLSYLVLPTGIFSFALLLVVTITSLPVVRRKNFNSFYFMHIIFAAIILILTCLHASTNFYFLLPGILLWIADWAGRVRKLLGAKAEAVVENAGNGWIRVRLPSKYPVFASDGEKSERTTSFPPSTPVLATYYVNFPRISKVQLHPFTAASTGSSELGPVLLFRRSPERKKAKQTEKEFTWAVAAVADVLQEMPSKLQVRIEGPYQPSIPEMYHADHILLLVGGTGITGAMTIAKWWAENFGARIDKFKSLRLIWSVHTEDIARLTEVQDLRICMAAFGNMEFNIHVSSQLGRLDWDKQLGEFLASRVGPSSNGAWVYASGPSGLLMSAETACVKEAKRQRQAYNDSANTAITKFEWYIAQWSL